MRTIRALFAVLAFLLVSLPSAAIAADGFNPAVWTGAWGSDGPIFTGDVNGDGKTDVFMWRASDKSWTINLSTGTGFAPQRWVGGWGSDGPIFTGDLNGDGKTDVFMWRNSDKSWIVNLSTGKGFIAQKWTGAWGSDGPIFTGDLNGDGKTDVFMWRASDKSWTVNLSTGTGFVQQRWVGAWGSDGPIFTGDLNGDGKTDVFMWRASDKSWTVNLSTGTGFVQQRWVGAWGSDGPIFTGDLNGDGKTDVFMWRAANKTWSVNLSTGTGFVQQAWVGAWGSDGPILTGDLNGDGKTDVFMWRNSNKDWTINMSTGTGFTMLDWTGVWGSDGPIFTGDLNGDGKTDVFMWRNSNKDWTINLSTPEVAVSEIPSLPVPAGSVGCPATQPSSRAVNNIDHPDTFDFVSCFRPRGNTDVWTIRKPDVTQADDPFSQIRFKRGDVVSVLAGGCAQTGAFGQNSWKRYVRPVNVTRNDDDNHFGSLSIPGVIGQTRLLDALHSPPISISTDPGAGASLHLEYADDNFRDNGYWNPDDGWLEQCRMPELAWTALVIQHNCAGMSSNPNCTLLSPLDVDVEQVDDNGLPLAPLWGLQKLAVIAPAPESLCTFTHKTVGMPEDNPDLCIHQVSEKNNQPLKCPEDSPDPTSSTFSTPGRIGGHINLQSATYQGDLQWTDHSAQDDDYNFKLFTDGGAGATGNDPASVVLEYDSDEVTDHQKTAFWRSLKQAVDAQDNTRALPLPGPTPGDMVGNSQLRRKAVIVGLLGIDCAHDCHSELHPVYVMAIRLNDDPQDDHWAFFARNWGSEGYCGPSNRPLRVGDPLNGNIPTAVTIVLPPPPTGTWSTASVIGQPTLGFSQDNAGMSVVPTPRAGAMALTFTLLPQDRSPLIDGDIHLKWIAPHGPPGAQ
jgi:hypothetical protein